MLDGLKVVLGNMITYIEKEFPRNTLKFWRLQSPRHFYGGDWNQNGSCLFNKPLEENEVRISKKYECYVSQFVPPTQTSAME
jgi:hypothetical protein